MSTLPPPATISAGAGDADNGASPTQAHTPTLSQHPLRVPSPPPPSILGIALASSSSDAVPSVSGTSVSPHMNTDAPPPPPRSPLGAFGIGAEDVPPALSDPPRRAPSPLDIHPLAPTPDRPAEAPRALSAPWLELESRAASTMESPGVVGVSLARDDGEHGLTSTEEQGGGGGGGTLQEPALEPLSFSAASAASPPTSPRRPSLQPWEFVDPPVENNNNNNFSRRTGTVSTRAGQTLRERASHPLIPKSSYYFGPPPPDAAYFSDPVGKIGIHHPREVLRIERDYTGGELIQFVSGYPLELEGRLTPTQFLESLNAINEVLIDAHSLRWAFFDNVIQIFSLQLSRLVLSTHYDKQMHRLQRLIESLNAELFNPVGLNILWPRRVAFLFMEIEYY